jgi:glycyl-tRNA synthetase
MIEVIEVTPKPRKIREVFGEKVGLIMRELSALPEDDVRESVLEKGGVSVAGEFLDKTFFDIRRIKKSIHVEPFIPHVVEPSFGLDRIAYATLEFAYREVKDRVVLSLPPYIAPYDACVYPLMDDDKLVVEALGIRDDLVSDGYRIFFDSKESIGRRYARGDEIGVPLAITIDYQTLDDGSVTVRDRDSWDQYRIKKGEIKSFLESIVSGEDFHKTASDMGLSLFTSKE